MNVTGTSEPVTSGERERLARAHHEICTALTVLCSNVALLRIHLRETPPPAAAPGAAMRVDADLDALEGAVERLHRAAREMRRWHDGGGPHPASEATRLPAGPVPLTSTP